MFALALAGEQQAIDLDVAIKNGDSGFSAADAAVDHGE
jgi:hypothetical protein